MTIKLSLFMLDPVTAHAKYMKEVAELNEKIEKKDSSHKELKLQYKLLKERMKRRTGELTVVSNKLSEERKLNQVWEN
jgi:hypothetical protein